MSYNHPLSSPGCQDHSEIVGNNEGASPWLPAYAALPGILIGRWPVHRGL